MGLENNIPEDWIETTLEENISEIAMGPFGSNLKRDMFTKEGVPIIKGTNLSGIYVGGDFTFVSEEKATSLRKAVAYPNDIIITHRGTIGQVSLVPQNKYKRYVTSQSQLRFCPDPQKLDYKYILYFLRSRVGQYELLKSSSQVGVPAIATPTKSIKEINLFLPSLPEQKTIAKVLTAFDDKIELLQAQNKTLETMAQTIFKEWFGKYQTNDKLPEGWRVGKITEIIERHSISYRCVKSDLDKDGLTPIIDQGKDGLYGYTKRSPDFIASQQDPVILFTNHTCNYWFIDYPFCAIQNVLPFKGKDGYDSYFIYFLTKGSVNFIEYKGHWPNLAAKDFIIPDKDSANSFSLIAKSILEKISNNNSQIQSLSKTRDTLLPKLMSGQVRVKI